MKKLMPLCIAIALYAACTIRDNPKPEADCLDGLEIIQNNPNTEVVTEDGYLKIKITDPQNVDDVVIRFTQADPQTERDYSFELQPVLEAFEYADGSTGLKSSHVAAAFVSYDFDTENPLISIYASGRLSNFLMEGFNRGFPKSAATEYLDLNIRIENTDISFNVGGAQFSQTWAGTSLPDPLTTEIHIGVLPTNNQNDGLIYAEYWIDYLKLEWWVTAEKDFSYSFDDC